MSISINNNISFKRKLRPNEQQDAQNTMSEALKQLDKEFGIIFPDSMAPYKSGEDTGMSTFSNNFSQNLFLSFLVQNGIKLNSIQDLPNGLRKRTDPSPFITNSGATDIFRIDLKALTTKDFGNILSEKTYNEILKLNEDNNPYVNNFPLSIISRDKVQNEIYKNFTDKIKNEPENTTIQKLGNDFNNFVEKNSENLEKFALYEILTKIHQNDYYPLWESDVDKNLYNKDFDSSKREARLTELKETHEKDIKAFMFSQMIAEKFIHKEVEKFKENGINIYNDIPICFSDAEVWANPSAFSKDLRLGSYNRCAQAWDFYIPDPNKLFNNDGTLGESGKLIFDKYKKCFEKYNFGARIDHVLGFINPWIYPKGKPDNGTRLFETLFANQREKLLREIILPAAQVANINTQNIIAEDLGYFTPETKAIVDCLGCTKMNLTRYKDHNYVMEAKPNTVAMVGSHDDIPLIIQEKNKLPKDKKVNWKILKQNIKERFIDLFTCPSKKVQIFISDLLGMTAEYKPLDYKNKDRWLLRTTSDTYNKHYQETIQDDMGFNMPEILLEACKRKIPHFEKAQPTLSAKLKLYSEILKEKE